MNYSNWKKKVDNADKYHEEWSSLFKCSTLEDYYQGFQWQSKGVTQQYYKPYVLNLVFSAIKTKLASILLRKFSFNVSPTPGTMDWDEQFAFESALLKGDVLNAIVSNPDLYFAKHFELTALDSMFRFGMIEVNYSANFDNPRKKPTITTEFTNEYVEAENAKVLDDFALPENEKIFATHRKASRFRVSTSDDPFLHNCSWCGYYAFVYEGSLRNTKGINFPSDYSGTRDYSARSGAKISLDPSSLKSGTVCKIIKIWDNEQNKKLIFLDGYYDEPLVEVPFEILPFEDVRWNLQPPSKKDVGYYPIPPVFNWLSPQDEVNQAREQMRNFRRRYTRKFTYTRGAVEIEELEKFKNEFDGEIIEEKIPNSIRTIDNPTIGATITGDLQVANDDFNKIAAVSQSQESDRTTATQSKINAVRETIREDAEKIEFSEFIGNCGRKILLIAREKLSTGMWVKYTSDPSQDVFSELRESGPVYKYVTSQQIDDGYDFTVALNIVDESPDKLQDEQTKYVTFLKLLMAFPMIAMSPTLIIETAIKCGYRNMKVIKEMQKMAQLAMMAQVQEGQKQLGQGQPQLQSPAEQSMNGNANPNPGSEIDSQLQAQL